MATVGQDRLLVSPAAGAIGRAGRRVPAPLVRPNFQSDLTIVAEEDSIYYGLALPRSRLVHGALICAHAAANAAIKGRLPGGPACAWCHLPTTTTRPCNC